MCAEAAATHRRELAEAHAALDPLAQMPPMNAAAVDRVAGALRAASAEALWWHAALGLTVLAYTLLAAMIVVRNGVHDEASLQMAIGAWLCAGLCMAVATRHARAAVLGAIVVAFALVFMGDTRFEEAPLGAGLKCMKAELMIGVVSGLVAASRGLRAVDPWRIASACAAGALAAQGAVSVTCHAPGGMTHTLLYHALGVALAAALGATSTWAWRARALNRSAAGSP
jgi:hypothetical protein